MATKKNIGEQISDAIQSAIDSQDYSNLKSTVEKSFSTAADSIARGLDQAAFAAQQASEEQARRQEALRAQREARYQEYQAKQAVQAQQRQLQQVRQQRYNSAGGRRALGLTLAIGGGVMASLFGFATLIFLPMALAAPDATSLAAMIFVAIPVAVGAVLLTAGIKMFGFASRFEKYQRILGLREYCSVQELADATQKKLPQVQADLKKMLTKGMFKQGHLDANATTLMVTSQSYAQYQNALNAAQQQKQAQLEAQKAEAAQRAKDRMNGLDEEAEAILERGNAFIAQIRASNEAIPGEEISRKIDQIELVIQTIFQRAKEHPEVIPDLDRLMSYYLPTTVKLLDAYEDLDKQPIQTENILKSKREIEDTLDALSVAFEKLLNSIFRDVAWDVSSDVSVLHAVLAQEGLVDDPFAKKTM